MKFLFVGNKFQKILKFSAIGLGMTPILILGYSYYSDIDKNQKFTEDSSLPELASFVSEI